MPDDLDTNLTHTNTTYTRTESGSLQTSLAALREQTLHKLRNGLRRGQQSMADWQGGQLAVSAVPGAGKSTGMVVAAAECDRS